MSPYTNVEGSIEIVYDPRNVEHIYWLKEDGVSYITFNLLERSHWFQENVLEDVIAANKKAMKLIKMLKMPTCNEVRLDP